MTTTQDTTHSLSDKGIVITAQAAPYLLDEAISLPAAVLYQSRLTNNLSWMQRFADAQGVKLAPHGKTTMTPALFQQQCEQGAWGLTLATPPQVAAAAEAGTRRVLMANQLVGHANMQLISQLLENPQLDFHCLVDSRANVEALNRFFTSRGQTLNVMIEMGADGGRCGCRTSEQALALGHAIAQQPALNLTGIETYEGVISGPNAPARIRQHLTWVLKTAQEVYGQGLFTGAKAILTGAGSAWYDLVVEVFSQADPDTFTTVIRPGCYLIHDQGIYLEAQQNVRQRLGDTCTIPGDLQSALEIWAYVQSLPEAGVAIIGLGKRDCAFDAGLPQPTLHFRPMDDTPKPAPSSWQVVKIMDQHATMTIPSDSNLRVGDMIAFSTSHPCLTFDKWRQLHVIDDQFRVLNTIDTFF
ncbi:amino acid deaminase [Gilvimarinus agarilyticus]|uniref:amino acid deaminase n=1 Tax=Gilvimarinus sp. 2_MG-2023 TaxID=3062666 RepID=UPI001C09FE3F|nr:amino acid deaminase [Gilvimarinus sp. 2_MG-2023]MBU2884513.1 amino acid deaminase [Gilvimarinus agarilyticus]MDO6569642.1 amino acid deaminase [Gilvimarinus sp. 2_MG-2023]